MSVNVELGELEAKVRELGTTPFLVTVRDDLRPHLVSVAAGWEGDALVMSVGSTTAANARERNEVSLVWPSTVGDYALIVDGAAVVEPAGSSGSAVVRVEPARAVLHRLASAVGDGPSCITVLSRTP